MAFENLKKSGIKYLLEKLKDIFVQIRDSVRSVNGTGPDENGNIAINVVPFARGLETESSQSNVGTFVMRTAGGEASVESGQAWLMQVLGNSEHIGYVPESLEMEVIPMERENPITATIDRDVFVAFVDQSGTITLTFTTEWSSSPALYGVTVTGSPVAGDVISIVYVKEERGTIIQASPQSFVSTGWNLYNHTAGYARVKRYAHGFRIDGTYTALAFATTQTGTQTEITPIAGAFNPFANLDPGVTEGYVFVTGGNSTDTAVYMTWEDWEGGYDWDSSTEQPGEFSAYTQTEVDLSGLYGEGKPLPYGLLSIGTAQDEIDLNLGTVTSRVERWEWSTSNLATAKASGREYDYDEDYIYIVRATPVVSAVSVSGSFVVNDHGLEWFEETDMAAEAHILYGNNLVNKLERDVLTISQQTLTVAQKTQVRTNIGLGTASTSAVANNLTTTSTGSVLDARQGRALNTIISSIEIRSVSIPLPETFSSGASYNTNLKTIIDADLPSGKKCIGIVGYDSSGSAIVFSQLRYANTNYSFQCYNASSAAYTNKTAQVQYLCINS